MYTKNRKISTKKVWTTLLLCVIVLLLCVNTFPISISHAKTIVANSEQIFATYTLDESVEQKLGHGNYSYEYISGFADENRYILVEGSNCYLIYDTILNTYIEYSESSNSPYYYMNVVTEKIYYAPTYYFARQNEEVVDLSSSTILSSKDELMYRQAAIEKKSADLQYVAAAKKVAGKLVNNSNASTSDYVVGHPGNNGDYNAVESFVPSYYYFESLQSYYPQMMESELFSNEWQKSLYEAMAMVLSYYDSIIDDRVIEDSFELKITNVLKPTKLYETSPRANYAYTEHIYNIFQECIESAPGGILWDSEATFKTAIQHCLENSGVYEDPYIAAKGNILDLKMSVYHGYPYILYIDDNLVPTPHYIIVYGYTFSDIYVHNVIANYSHTIRINNSISYAGDGIALRIDYSNWYLGTHTNCPNNYLWTSGLASGSRCPVCDKITCFHSSGQYSCLNTLLHQKECTFCGDISIAPHTFKTIGGVSTCTSCGYMKHTHTYVYTPMTTTIGYKHSATCTICGFGQTEDCAGYATFEGTVCRKCGRLMSSGGIIFNNETEC